MRQLQLLAGTAANELSIVIRRKKKGAAPCARGVLFALGVVELTRAVKALIGPICYRAADLFLRSPPLVLRSPRAGSTRHRVWLNARNSAARKQSL